QLCEQSGEQFESGQEVTVTTMQQLLEREREAIVNQLCEQSGEQFESGQEVTVTTMQQLLEREREAIV
ncbi:hypothetical protein CPL67_28370, partial [Klebsiella pneumoniae]